MANFTWPGLLIGKMKLLAGSIADSLSITSSDITTANITTANVTTLNSGGAVNKVTFDSNGHMLLNGSATVWEDISEPLSGKNLYSTPGTADYDWVEEAVVFQPSGDIANDGDIVAQKYQLRHKTKPGSLFMFHIHWEQTNATARTFTWKYRKQNQGAAKTTAWSDPIVVSTANSAYTYVSGTLNQITHLGEIDTTGLSLSSVIQVKLTRSDAVAGNILATFIDMHYEADSLGSNQEYIK